MNECDGEASSNQHLIRANERQPIRVLHGTLSLPRHSRIIDSLRSIKTRHRKVRIARISPRLQQLSALSARSPHTA
jgi:hypothetical protein